MVTAGVYLIARTHGLFLMTPEVLHLVGIVGAVTWCWRGFAALVQTDIKRVLAYSTMSQIGYMFPRALGVQAWDAAIFHLMTHAFFKALLFLSSGSVIPGLPSRTEHLQDGRPAQIDSAGMQSLLPGGGRGAVRTAAYHRRLLQ